jgi:formylglycine-generating enzyme required for sulfatase activity
VQTTSPVAQPQATDNPLVIRPQPSVVKPYEAKLPAGAPLTGELGIGSARLNAKDGAKMLWVPAGEFRRGTVDANGWWNARPVAQVYVDGFWIYETEVTVKQYREFCEDTNRTMPHCPWGTWKDDHPIVGMSWDDANAYAKWANASLPTEAQWEKAARGTDGRTYPWGSTFDTSRLWCSITQIMDAGLTAPVGSFPSGKSPYGCLDMAGNAEEWCSDWYADYYYQTSPLRNPTGPPTGTEHTTRGGSWYRFESDGAGGWFKSAMRRKFIGGQEVGFRCVQNP